MNTNTIKFNEEFKLGNHKEKLVRGSIWFAELKGEGSVQSGKRPVIITSNWKNNKFAPTVQVVTLTTQKMNKSMPTHVFIRANEEANGLRVNSKALCEQVITIDKSQLKAFVGQLEMTYIDKINKALMIQLELENNDYIKELEMKEKNIIEKEKRFDKNYIYEIVNTINETILIYDRFKSDLLVNLIKENVSLLKKYCESFKVNPELYVRKYEKYILIEVARNFKTHFNNNEMYIMG